MPAAILGFPPSAARDAAAPSDTRYRDLAGPAAWMRLPAAVRRRFSRRLAAQEQVVYRGEVMLTELSRAGWLLAQAARILGGPIPFTPGATGPSVVAVTEEPALDGQVWTRIYARHGRFPQVIHSAKRFRGPTGLEEDLGHGLLMRLTMHVEDERGAEYAKELSNASYLAAVEAIRKTSAELEAALAAVMAGSSPSTSTERGEG